MGVPPDRFPAIRRAEWRHRTPVDAHGRVPETFPRQALASFLRDALGDEASRKPDCTMTVLIRDFQFPDLLGSGPGEHSTVSPSSVN
ncbi:hypothetical protein [Streptomyces sp. NBC_00690]|uniref:hypothetical protein n=1 Tax=Streptomyces sp. NBC_00690 TaxID=2975808 RepID=UPI002E2844A1|nr:hypothetical protein [Streptomyces sp. NBC_00690]